MRGGGGVIRTSSIELQLAKMQTCWIRFPEDSTSTAKWKYSCYVRLPTDTHSWFHVRRSFHKIRQNWGVQILHNSTIIYIHVHNMTYTRRTFWYRGELCSFGSRCGVNIWFAIPEWAVFTKIIHLQQRRCTFLPTKWLHFQPSTCLMMILLWIPTMGQGTLPFWNHLYFRWWRITHIITATEDYILQKRSYGSATHLSVRDVRL